MVKYVLNLALSPSSSIYAKVDKHLLLAHRRDIGKLIDFLILILEKKTKKQINMLLKRFNPLKLLVPSLQSKQKKNRD